MDIREALKETGKAVHGGFASYQEGYSWYVERIGCDLVWRTGAGVKRENATFLEITRDDWQPYHEEKEIRPEKAGELWETKTGFKLFVYRGEYEYGGLVLKREDGYTFNVNNLPDGLKRLYPPVEDENVERIEVEYSGYNFLTLHLTPCVDSFAHLIDKMNKDIPKKKMILEIPK
jgi:hypothetical protein